MNRIAKKVSGVLLALGIAATPAFALAHTRNFPHPEPKLVNLLTGSWNTYGNVATSSDGAITLTENGSENEYAYKDVAVSGHAGDIAVLVSYTKAENVRSNDITGLPYLYAYAMNNDGKILAYFQGKDMLRAGTANVWQVNNGTFRIPSGTTKIRYFLQQAEKSGSSKNGDDAKFYMPALYIVERAERAQDAIQNYKFGLSLVD